MNIGSTKAKHQPPATTPAGARHPGWALFLNLTRLLAKLFGPLVVRVATKWAEVHGYA